MRYTIDIRSLHWLRPYLTGEHMSARQHPLRRSLAALAAVGGLITLGLLSPAGPAEAAVTGNVFSSPGGKCVDVSGDDTAVNTTPVQLWYCLAGAADQHWSWSGTALTTIGR